MGKFLSRLVLTVVFAMTLFFCIVQYFDQNSFTNRLFAPEPAPKLMLAQKPITESVEFKPNPIELIDGIQKLARLETAGIKSRQIIYGGRDQKRLWGAFGETITFVAYGQVIAGVDLSNFSKFDMIVTNPTSIEIRLPKSKIFSVIIDNYQSYVANHNKGILASSDKDMESKARRRAGTECKNNAIRKGILDDADKNARDIIRKLSQSFGFKNVSFAE